VGASDLVLGVRLVGASRQIRAVRLLAARLAERGWDYPIALGALTEEDSVVPLPAKADGNGEASDAPSTILTGLPLGICITLGSPILDGLGDLVRIDPGAGDLSDVAGARLAFDCLQAVGARSFKAELIACPGCRRTLFDLQSTTERIKSRTGHLVGVKIAVMGCVVNGPGELADADFGYMGGAPGRVSLFVGRECVARNLPEAEADDRLVDLIRVHGRWIEPE
jgi:(E)-4-hydroxy-3-methylbut-2-enyl-diphosphate synthase